MHLVVIQLSTHQFNCSLPFVGIKKATSKPKKDAQAEMFAAALAAAPKSKAQKEAELRFTHSFSWYALLSHSL